MKKKIEYSTCYDGTNRICGYVLANDYGTHYEITQKQYDRALRNRTIGGDAGLNFHADKIVRVV